MIFLFRWVPKVFLFLPFSSFSILFRSVFFVFFHWPLFFFVFVFFRFVVHVKKKQGDTLGETPFTKPRTVQPWNFAGQTRLEGKGAKIGSVRKGDTSQADWASFMSSQLGFRNKACPNLSALYCAIGNCDCDRYRGRFYRAIAFFIWDDPLRR